MRLKDQEITVLGAGIGGLAVAYALARAGARVWVLEQAETLRSSGAGLQLSPNGMAVLRALGLWDALRPITVAAQAVQLRDAASGRSVARLDLGRLRPDQHYRFVSRGALIAELAKAAEGGGGGDRYRVARGLGRFGYGGGLSCGCRAGKRRAFRC